MPPWRIPSVIKRSACVVVPERDFPIVQHTPILPREVLATGGCLVLSEEIYHKLNWLGLRDKESVLVINPKNIPEFQKALETLLENPEYRESLGKRARQLSEATEKFKGYIDDMLRLYEEVLRKYHKKNHIPV